MHFYHKHNWDPDNRAGQHQPPEHHGPARIVVSSISHRFPLVKTEAKNKLETRKESKKSVCLNKQNEPATQQMVGIHTQIWYIWNTDKSI